MVWKPAFKNRTGEGHPQYKGQCKNIEVLHDSAMSITSYEMGAVNQNLRARTTLASEVEQRLDKRMPITKENLKETDCATIQQMIEVRRGKNRRETMKHVTKIVDESRKSLQEQRDNEDKQQLDIETCFENAKLDENRRKPFLHPKAPPPDLRHQGAIPRWTDLWAEQWNRRRRGMNIRATMNNCSTICRFGF